MAANGARDSVARHNDFFFDALGISRGDAEAARAEASTRSGRSVRADESIHFLAFAALKAAGFRPATVLELGTDSGETTAYLACLFPDATIDTVELPDDDPILRHFHGSGIDPAALAKRLAAPQIRAHRVNTAFLASLDLPEFDLIWLDAGHEYPEVAWDHAYCLGRLRPGGWLLSDDIRPPENRLFRGRPGAFDAWNVTEYLKARGANIRYLLKRDDPRLYLLDRKYVAAMQKAPA